MGNNLKKKYGLLTAIAMVVGIVVGSGVFFKAEVTLNATGGNLKLGILAWIVGGVVMVISALAFANMATRYEKVNGLVDYAEVMVGGKYAYFIGWFMATIYLPTLTSVLAWVSARYFCVIIGESIVGPFCLALAAFFLIGSYSLNALSPVLAGKFQVSTTVIKLIPLALMAVVGLIVGLIKGVTIENFTTIVDSTKSNANGFLTAVCATSFAYEGWIIATSINAELKDAKKNLPIALVLGTLITMAIYILYYLGLAGSIPNSELMGTGAAGVQNAFSAIFSKAGGTIAMVFVVISCLGTLNGLTLGCTRGLYSLAVRNEGPRPDVFKQVDAKTNMPTNSSVFGLLLSGFWLLYFYTANLHESGWLGVFSFDSSELPIITAYALYIPIYISYMIKEKEESNLKRFVIPALAIVAACVMIYSSIASHKMANVYYLIVFVVVMFIGWLVMKPNSKYLESGESLQAVELTKEVE